MNDAHGFKFSRGSYNMCVARAGSTVVVHVREKRERERERRGNPSQPPGQLLFDLPPPKRDESPGKRGGAEVSLGFRTFSSDTTAQSYARNSSDSSDAENPWFNAYPPAPSFPYCTPIRQPPPHYLAIPQHSTLISLARKGGRRGGPCH